MKTKIGNYSALGATLTLMVVLASILPSSAAVAREAKATLCADEAVRRATAAFMAKMQPQMPPYTYPELVERGHSIAGQEVWDIHFNVDGVDYDSFRVTMAVPNCRLITLVAPAQQP